MSALYFLDYVKSGGRLMLTRSDMKHGGQFLRSTTGYAFPLLNIVPHRLVKSHRHSDLF
jgi:hypothetical protein